uniref:Chorion class high-cysteine HCB protein 12-like n=1 Tax=Panagrellus redivivus TaxID=6233 RepID=A0A7E4V3U4_PANRE
MAVSAIQIVLLFGMGFAKVQGQLAFTAPIASNVLTVGYNGTQPLQSTNDALINDTAVAVIEQPAATTAVALRAKRQWGGFGGGCCGMMINPCCLPRVPVPVPLPMPMPMPVPVPVPVISGGCCGGGMMGGGFGMGMGSCCGCCMPVCMPMCMRGGCGCGGGFGFGGFGRKKRELILERHGNTLKHFLLN